MKVPNLFILIIIFLTMFKESYNLSSKNNNENNLSSKSRSKHKKFFSMMKTKLKSKMMSLFKFKLNNLKELSVKQRFQGYPIVSIDDESLGEGPIFYEGWEKYFVILGKSKTNEKKFLVNEEYYKETNFTKMVRNKYDEKEFVPDKMHFYFILSEDYLSVVDSKIENTRKTIDMCYIKNIDEINLQKSNVPKGGIEDVGNFQEGFCFKIKGQTTKTYFKWIVCADDYNNKMLLMKKLMLLRLRYQVKSMKKTETTATVNINIFDSNRKKRLRYNSTSRGINQTEELKGKWIILQDWSTCTLACGGGTQTRHRYCVFPPSGIPCEGKAIETRSCNTDPCSNITQIEDNLDYLPTQIKILRVSQIPQRYKKCEYKEEDLDVVREDIPNLKIFPRVPSRVIMNNRTISFFESSTYDSLLKSFYLRELITVKRYEDDPQRCLYISDKIKHVVMCVMPNDPMNPRTKIENWIKDINDFKNNCSFQRKSITLTDPRIKKYIHDLEEEKMSNQAKLWEENKENQEDKNDQKNLKAAEVLSLKAIDKEIKYEERLEREELMREREEDEEMKNAYICEERKNVSYLYLNIYTANFLD